MCVASFRLPNAYPNCPMVPFGVYAFKQNSDVQISLMREFVCIFVQRCGQDFVFLPSIEQENRRQTETTVEEMMCALGKMSVVSTSISLACLSFATAFFLALLHVIELSLGSTVARISPMILGSSVLNCTSTFGLDIWLKQEACVLCVPP